MMGFLNDLKAKAKDTIGAAAGGKSSDDEVEDYPEISHGDQDAPDSMEDQNAVAGDEDEDEDDVADDMQSMRPDFLSLLGIPANYKVGNDVLLPKDLDNIELSYEEPRGYSREEVDRLFVMVSNSLKWYADHLNMRNKDVAVLASRLDKAATDLHNQKVNEALSEGLQVVTGQESTAETQLQKAQLEIIQLKDKVKKLERATGRSKSPEPGDSRFDELQNQLGILQTQNRKLIAQNKRLRLGKSSEEEEDFSLDKAMSTTSADSQDDLPAPDFDDDSEDLPVPDLDDQVVKNESQTNESTDMFDLAEEEDNTDLDVSRDALKPKKRKGKKKLEADPDYSDKNDDLPLPEIMDDDYQVIGYPTDDDSSEVDMSDYMTSDE